jgi:hypothetical protein
VGDLTYLLIGAATFLVAKGRMAQRGGAVAPPTGSPPSNPPPNLPPIAPTDRVALIQSLWNNQIPGLDYVRYALHIGQRESGSNYRPANQKALNMGYPLGMNDFGFAGMYQMGAAALETQGYIKAGTTRRKGTGGNYKILTTQANWTEKCPGGIEQFMNTPAIQEEAMLKMTRGNYRALRSMGVLADSTPATIKAGYLASAHLKGPGGAAALARGEVLEDGYHTRTDSYYKGGAASQVA